MAGSKGSKYYDIFLDYNVWLTSKEDRSTLDDEKMWMLKYISTEGSLTAAANKMKISYRKAWGDLNEAEEFLGVQLVEKSRGGSKGGSTSLTKEGQILVDAYFKLHDEINNAIKKITREFFQTINK